MTIYSIYRFTNLVNDKTYIGKTSQKPQVRKLAHIKSADAGSHLLLHRAIAKYGKENFEFEVIFCTFSKPDLNDYEKLFIEIYDCCYLDDRSRGYNMTRGGDGGTRDSEDARRQALARVADHTHPFMGTWGSEMSTKNNLQRVKAGTNPFAGSVASRRSSIREKEKIANGIHPFSGELGSALQHKRVKDGTHPLAGPAGSKRATEFNIKRVLDGTHPFSGDIGARKQSKLQQDRISAGTHCSQVSHECPHCGHIGKGNPMFRWHFDRCKTKT